MYMRRWCGLPWSSSAVVSSTLPAVLIEFAVVVQPKRFNRLFPLENTLANTPSGYVQDPTAHPMSFRNYEKPTSDHAKVLERMAAEAELQENELEYRGFTTIEIQAFKKVALDQKSGSEDLAAAEERLSVILEELRDTASGDSGFVSRADCHHVRFILSLCNRRLNRLAEAERHLNDILQDEPWNVDACEGLLELYVADTEVMKKKLKGLLDWLTERERVHLAYSLLADFLITAASRHFEEHGEGSTSTYVMKELTTLAQVIGPDHMRNLLDVQFNNFDELHYSSVMSKPADRDFVAQVIVAYLKTLVARELWRMSDEPLVFQFHVLNKLCVALRNLKRRQESYGICERMIKLFRNNPEALQQEEDIYQIALFQYVNDRANDSPVVARKLCIEAIEEFPNNNVPWKILSAVLHREGEYENAIVAAKKSLSLNPNDYAALLLLANLFEVTKRPKLSEEVMERYRQLMLMADQQASDEDQQALLSDTLDMEDRVQEVDLVETQFRDITEHQERYHQAHLYSKDVVTKPEEDLHAVNRRVDRDPQLLTRMSDFVKKAELQMKVSPKQPSS